MKIIDIPFLTELTINMQSVVCGGNLDITNIFPITVYKYRGKLVYYVPSASCCIGDQFNTLYDASGKVLCNPNGGITGLGDGKCVGFFGEAKKVGIISRTDFSKQVLNH